ncbi:MAG: hypothetical protein H6736_05550 [Alphaproteobacteria bacterium]|nr:hypothetical protein [Alphaproteobacteria bacterium]MCB9691264.1 hypothetical protein [Alphaproteobacteria bacterium]
MRALLALSLLTACGEPPVAPQAQPAPAEPAAKSAPASEATGPVRVAKVLEVIQEAPDYTYARMDACGQEAWVAGPKVSMEVGQAVEMVGGQGMAGFESAALNRTFDALLMVDGWRLSNTEPVCEAAGQPGDAPGEPLRFGSVKQILGASSYTFLELDVCGETVWIAGPERKDIEVGGLVATPLGMENREFYSKSLNMKFDPIYFVNTIKKAKALPPCPP